MPVVITSTTAPQAELDHAVSEDWRKGQEPAEEPAKPVVEEPAKEEPEQAKEEPPKPKEHKSGWQKRIDKLTARNHSLETRLAELETKAKPAETNPEPQGPKEPKLADFGNDVEKFLVARDAWKEAEEVRANEQERQKAVFENYNKKTSEARGEYEDWDEVVTGSQVKIPQSAYLAVVESDNGPDIAYYLGQHPEEAEALNEVSPIAAVRIIGKISDKLSGAKEAPAPKKKVVPPEPLAPVGASATRSSVSLDQLPVREYIKIRNKQERENRR